MLSVLRVFSREQMDAVIAHVQTLLDPATFARCYGADVPDLTHEEFLSDLNSDWQVGSDFLGLCSDWVIDFAGAKFNMNHSHNGVFNTFHFIERGGTPMPYNYLELDSTDMVALKGIYLASEMAKSLNQKQMEDWWLYYLLSGGRVSIRRKQHEHPALKYLTKHDEYCYGYLTRNQVEAILPPSHPDSFAAYIKRMIEIHSSGPQFWFPAVTEWETTLEKIKNLPYDEFYLFDLET